MKQQAGRHKDLIDIDRMQMKKVDYSSEAITRRLRQTEHLRRLSLSLMKAKKASRRETACSSFGENRGWCIDKKKRRLAT